MDSTTEQKTRYTSADVEAYRNFAIGFWGLESPSIVITEGGITWRLKDSSEPLADPAGERVRDRGAL